MSAQKESTTTLFISSLPGEADEEIITKHFEKINSGLKVKNVTIFRNKHTYRSKGVGLIELFSVEDCKSAHKLSI